MAAHALPTIHWVGSGLSSGPGLTQLIDAGRRLTLWSNDLPQARALLAGRDVPLHLYAEEALTQALAPGDVVVSMVPPTMHAGLARIALARGAHFACSSYLSPELLALDTPAREAGVRVLAECGLDPGIDHLMAHDLVARYRDSAGFDPENSLRFQSYCGGFPQHSNAFRYKFSWSPLGVLRALRSPSRSIRHFSELTVQRPWDAVSRYAAPLPTPETFEVYPNRDSLPYLAEYRFDPDWKIEDFVRGTLRPFGWAEAWGDVFAALEDDSPGADDRLAALADRLWQENSYAEGEPDRVVLIVSLEARRDGQTVFHECWSLDATGDARGSAMARLVSGTLALGVEAILAQQIPAGVHPAPHDPALVAQWLNRIDTQSRHLTRHSLA